MDKVRLRTSLRKIKEMCVKMNKTTKSNRNESCMSSLLWVTFLVPLFLFYWETWVFAAVLAKVNQWHWTKEIIYKINFLEHRLKNFLFAGACIFIEPEHKARKMKVDYKMTKREVLFVKIGVKVLDLWFDTSSWPKWPKCSL